MTEEKYDYSKNSPNNWVVCAAIRDPKTGLIFCGARHGDKVMMAQ